MMGLLLLSVSAEVSKAQTNLTKAAGNPVISVGPSGSWDDVNAVHPFVLFDGSIYRMYYVGTHDIGRIGLATSFDGVSWTKYSGNPVLREGPSGSWDSGGVGPASVLFDGTTYKMWYRGNGGGSLGRIGFATSTDGVNWVKYSGNPVVSSAPWASAVADPYVVLKDGVYRMYFAGFDSVTHDCGVLDGNIHFCIGLAQSTDGITWNVLSKPVLTEGPSGSWDSAHMSRPVVIVQGTTWHMWYTGQPFGPSQIGYASSSDGISWTKSAGNPILTWGSPGSWDSVAVGAGTVIIDSSGFKMWYSGADTLIQSPDQVAHFQIGLATDLAQTMTCGSIITEDTTLANDLVDCSTDGLTIGADNIVLDCNGHSISGNAFSGNSTLRNSGVLVQSKTNITVKNCHILDFFQDIELASTIDSILVNNKVERGVQSGILLSGGSYNNTIMNNIALDNFNGFLTILSSNNTLFSNLADHNINGFFLLSASYNTLLNNTAEYTNNNDNNFAGVFLDHSSNNILKFNSVIDNTNGFWLTSASSNLLTSNLVLQNTYGLRLSTCFNNVIYDNVFNNTANAADTFTPGQQQWNITKTPGANVIGGSFLGGNFWSDYNGTDTDGDGLGDTNLPYASSGGIGNGGDFLPLVFPVEPLSSILVSKFFTDPNLNPLPQDSFSNPKVDVILARGLVKATIPGQILAWVNVTNTGAVPLQSLRLNDTLPVDWTLHPPWMPSKGAIHVYFVFANGTRSEITDQSTINVTRGGPETVFLSIANITGTAAQSSLSPSESILLSAKLSYALTGTSQTAGSYPRNYTDAASAIAWTQPSYLGARASSTGSAFFIAYPKVVGDVNGDGRVNIFDLTAVGGAFGSRTGEAPWNAAADLNNDGVINIFDLTIVGTYFGG